MLLHELTCAIDIENGKGSQDKKENDVSHVQLRSKEDDIKFRLDVMGSANKRFGLITCKNLRKGGADMHFL